MRNVDIETMRALYSSAQMAYRQETGRSLNNAVRGLLNREPNSPTDWVVGALIVLTAQAQAPFPEYLLAAAPTESDWPNDYEPDSIAGEHAMMAYMGEDW